MATKKKAAKKKAATKKAGKASPKGKAGGKKKPGKKKLMKFSLRAEIGPPVPGDEENPIGPPVPEGPGSEG